MIVIVILIISRVLKQLNINKKYAKGPQMTGQTVGRMDEHIILPIRVFDPVACGRMHFVQLWDALYNSQK